MASVKNPPIEYPNDENIRIFGTFNGVFTRVVTSIFGVIMFLRIGWMVSVVGQLLTIVIILISTFITVSTVLSMSTLLTNGKIIGGGPYYLLSRSVGIEWGSMLSLTFSIAQIVAIALNTSGLAEELLKLYDSYFTGSRTWDLVIVTVISNTVLFCIVCFGIGWVNRLNIGFFTLILLGVLSFIIGTIINKEGKILDYTSYNLDTLNSNLYPKWESPSELFTTIGIFFPCVTGIMQGMNMASSLRNPTFSVPVGTLSAIGLTTFTYLLIAVLNAATAKSPQLYDTENRSYMKDIAYSGEVVFIAGVSSAIAAALDLYAGAPRVLAATLSDNLFPRLYIFTRQNKKGDPIYGYILCLVFANIVTVCGAGKLDKIAPAVTCLYLVTYGALNFSCVINDYLRAPFWRPSFKYNNIWISLIGFLASQISLFIVNIYYAILCIIITISQYIYCVYNKPDVDVGGGNWSLTYISALNNLIKLEKEASTHITTFLPSFMVISNFCQPTHVRYMMEICSQFYGGRGQLSLGTVLKGIPQDIPTQEEQTTIPLSFDMNTQSFAFHFRVICPTTRIGTLCLMQTAGLGILQPRIMVFEYPYNWKDMDTHEIDVFIDLIRDAFLLKKCIMIVRLPQRIIDDIDECISEIPIDSVYSFYDKKNNIHKHMLNIKNDKNNTDSTADNINNKLFNKEKNEDVSQYIRPLNDNTTTNNNNTSDDDVLINKRKKPIGQASDQQNIFLPEKYRKNSRNIDNINQIQDYKDTRMIIGNIDVHWLTDDGGLSILLAHIQGRNSLWKEATIRTFITSQDNEEEREDAIQQQREQQKAVRIDAKAELLDTVNNNKLELSKNIDTTTISPPKSEQIDEIDEKVDNENDNNNKNKDLLTTTTLRPTIFEVFDEIKDTSNDIIDINNIKEKEINKKKLEKNESKIVTTKEEQERDYTKTLFTSLQHGDKKQADVLRARRQNKNILNNSAITIQPGRLQNNEDEQDKQMNKLREYKEKIKYKNTPNITTSNLDNINEQIDTTNIEYQTMQNKRLKQFQSYGDAIRNKAKKSNIPTKFIIISMPLPAVIFSNTEWLNWQDVLSSGHDCPVVFVRGNDTTLTPFM